MLKQQNAAHKKQRDVFGARQPVSSSGVEAIHVVHRSPSLLAPGPPSSSLLSRRFRMPIRWHTRALHASVCYIEDGRMSLLRLISWPYVRRHMLRSLLTIAGIVLGVGLLVAMR